MGLENGSGGRSLVSQSVGVTSGVPQAGRCQRPVEIWNGRSGEQLPERPSSIPKLVKEAFGAPFAG